MRCLGSDRGDGELTTGLWLGEGDSEPLGDGDPACCCGPPHEATVNNIATSAPGRAKLRSNTSAQCVIDTKRGPASNRTCGLTELGQPARTAKAGRLAPPSIAAFGP